MCDRSMGCRAFNQNDTGRLGSRAAVTLQLFRVEMRSAGTDQHPSTTAVQQA